MIPNHKLTALMHILECTDVIDETICRMRQEGLLEPVANRPPVGWYLVRMENSSYEYNCARYFDGNKWYRESDDFGNPKGRSVSFEVYRVLSPLIQRWSPG